MAENTLYNTSDIQDTTQQIPEASNIEAIDAETPQGNTFTKDLYKKLVKTKDDFGVPLFSDTYDAFKNKYSNKEKVDFLYNGLKEDKLIDEDENTFYDKYFPEIKAQEPSQQPVQKIEETQQVIQEDPPYKKLWEKLNTLKMADGNSYYPGTYEDFSKEIESENGVSSLFNKVKDYGLLDKIDQTPISDESDFYNRYFPDYKKKEPSITPSLDQQKTSQDGTSTISPSKSQSPFISQGETSDQVVASTTPKRNIFRQGEKEMSLSDWLKSKKMPYDKSSREKYAEQYGVQGYNFTIEKNDELLDNIKTDYDLKNDISNFNYTKDDDGIKKFAADQNIPYDGSLQSKKDLLNIAHEKTTNFNNINDIVNYAVTLGDVDLSVNEQQSTDKLNEVLTKEANNFGISGFDIKNPQHISMLAQKLKDKQTTMSNLWNNIQYITPVNKPSILAEALETLGLPNDKETKAKLAKEYGIVNEESEYIGDGSQNEKLRQKLSDKAVRAKLSKTITDVAKNRYGLKSFDINNENDLKLLNKKLQPDVNNIVNQIKFQKQQIKDWEENGKLLGMDFQTYNRYKLNKTKFEKSLDIDSKVGTVTYGKSVHNRGEEYIYDKNNKFTKVKISQEDQDFYDNAPQFYATTEGELERQNDNAKRLGVDLKTYQGLQYAIMHNDFSVFENDPQWSALAKSDPQEFRRKVREYVYYPKVHEHNINAISAKQAYENYMQEMQKQSLAEARKLKEEEDKPLFNDLKWLFEDSRMFPERASYLLGYLWNGLEGGATHLVGSAYGLLEDVDALTGGAITGGGLTPNKTVSNWLKNDLKDALSINLHGTDKYMSDGFVLSAAHDIAYLTPSAVATISGVPVGFAVEGYGSAMDNINSTPEGQKLPLYQKMIFATANGTANALITKLGIEKIFGSNVTNKIALNTTKDVFNMASRNGIKLTPQTFENLAIKDLNSLKNKTLRILGHGGTGAVFGGAMGVTDLLGKEAINLATGKNIFELPKFNMPTNFNDILNPEAWGSGWAELATHLKKGAVMGVMGGSMSEAKNKQESYLKTKVTQAESIGQIEELKGELQDAVNKKQISQADLEKYTSLINEYTVLNEKIPQTITDPNTRVKIADKLKRRLDLENEINDLIDQKTKEDPVFHQEIDAKIDGLRSLIDKENRAITNIYSGKTRNTITFKTKQFADLPESELPETLNSDIIDIAEKNNIQINDNTTPAEIHKILKQKIESENPSVSESVESIIDNYKKIIADSEEQLKSNPNDKTLQSRISESKTEINNIIEDPVRYIEGLKNQAIEDVKNKIKNGADESQFDIDEITDRFDDLIEDAKTYAKDNPIGSESEIVNNKIKQESEQEIPDIVQQINGWKEAINIAKKNLESDPNNLKAKEDLEFYERQLDLFNQDPVAYQETQKKNALESLSNSLKGGASKEDIGYDNIIKANDNLISQAKIYNEKYKSKKEEENISKKTKTESKLSQSETPSKNVETQKEEIKYSIDQLEKDLQDRVDDFVSKGATKEDAQKLAYDEFPSKDKEALQLLKDQLRSLESKTTEKQEEYDQKDVTGVSGKVGVGEEPIKTEPVKGAGTEATPTGGVLQTSGTEGKVETTGEKVTETPTTKTEEPEIPEQKHTIKTIDKAEIDVSHLDQKQQSVATKAIKDAKRIIKSVHRLIGKNTGKDLQIVFHPTEASAINQLYKNFKEAGFSDEEALKQSKEYVTKGWYSPAKGEIHLVLPNVGETTATHELFHPVLNYIAENNPKVIKSFVKQMIKLDKGLEIYKKNEYNYAERDKDGNIVTNDVGEIVNQNEINLEAITDYVSKIADGKIELSKSNFESIRDYIVKMLQYMGIATKKDISEIEDLRELAKEITEKFATGDELTAEKESSTESYNVSFSKKILTEEDRKKIAYKEAKTIINENKQRFAETPEAVAPQVQVDKDGKPKIEINVNDKGETDVKVLYKQEPYNLENGATKYISKDVEKAKNALADKIVEDYKQNINRSEINSAFGWYGNMRAWFQRNFGANIELFGQLLAATSARTNVVDNFKQAVDAMRNMSKGNYNKLLEDYGNYVNDINSLSTEQLQEKWQQRNPNKKLSQFNESDFRKLLINEYNDVPLRSNGKKFNANSKKVLQALYGNWIEQTKGPKTKNFAGNLTGRSFKATIDVWAARYLRRKIYEGNTKQWRILPESEKGVDFNELKSGELSGDYPFAEDVMQIAANKLNIKADDLQAFLWYLEKDVWEKNNWTNKAGGSKSSFEETASRLSTDRYQLAVTTFKDEQSFDKTKFEQERQSIQDEISKIDGIISSRVTASQGEFVSTEGTFVEPTFDVEFTVEKGSDISSVEKKIYEIQDKYSQDAVIISKLTDKEDPNARPIIEIGLSNPVENSEIINDIKTQLADLDIRGFTIARDSRGRILGIRAQFVPEFESGVSQQQGFDRFVKGFEKIKEKYADNEEVSYITADFVNSKVKFKSNEAKLDGESGLKEQGVQGVVPSEKSGQQEDVGNIPEEQGKGSERRSDKADNGVDGKSEVPRTGIDEGKSKEQFSRKKKEEATGISKEELEKRYNFTKTFDSRNDQKVADDAMSNLSESAKKNNLSIDEQAENDVALMKYKTGSVSEQDIMTAAYHLKSLDAQIEKKNNAGEDASLLLAKREVALETLRMLGNNAGRNLRLFSVAYRKVEEGRLEATRAGLKKSLNVPEVPKTMKDLDASNMSEIDKNKVKPYVEAIEQLDKDLKDIDEKANEDIKNIDKAQLEEYINNEIKRRIASGEIKTTQTKREKTLSEKGTQLANKIRKLKINTGKLSDGGAQSNIAGAPIFVYNKLVDLVAGAVEGGATLAEAISIVLKDPKNLDDKYKITEKQLEDYVINGIDISDKKDDAISKIKEIAQKDNVSTITPEMANGNLINHIVNSIIHSETPYEKVISEATAEIKELLPDVTEQEVSDALLKKGKFKKKSKKETIQEIEDKKKDVRRLIETKNKVSAIEAGVNAGAPAFDNSLSSKEKKAEIEKRKSDYEKGLDKKIEEANKKKKEVDDEIKKAEVEFKKANDKKQKEQERIKELQDKLALLESGQRPAPKQKGEPKVESKEIEDLKAKIEEADKNLRAIEKERNAAAAKQKRFNDKVAALNQEIDFVNKNRAAFKKALNDPQKANEELKSLNDDLKAAYNQAGIRIESGSKNEIKIAQDAEAEIKAIKESNLPDDVKERDIKEVEKRRDEQIKNTKQGVLVNLKTNIDSYIDGFNTQLNEAIANGDVEAQKEINNILVELKDLSDLSSKLSPNIENLKDQIDKADQKLSELIEKTDGTELQNDIHSIQDKFREDWQATSDEMQKNSLINQAERDLQEAERRMNAGQFTEIPTTKFDAKRDEVVSRKQALAQKAWKQLNGMSMKAKEKQQQQGVASKWVKLRRDFMIMSLGAIEKVAGSAVTKPIIDPLIRQTFGRISGVMTGVRPSSLKKIGMTYGQEFKNQESANKYITATNDEYISALDKYENDVKEFGEDSKQAVASKEKLDEAEMQKEFATAYLFINANSAIDIAQIMVNGATDFDAKMGKSRQSFASERTKLEGTWHWIESINRTHGAMKSVSHRQALLDEYLENLQYIQDRDGFISMEKRQEAWDLAVLRSEAGRFGEETSMSRMIGKFKSSESNWKRNLANYLFPVAKVGISLTKQGIDMAFPGVELFGRALTDGNIRRGLKLNEQDGIEYNNSLSTFYNGMKRGYQELPLQQKKYINTLITRGLFGLAQYATVGYLLSSGAIKYGGSYNPYDKKKIMGSDGKPLEHGEWEIFGKRMPGLFNIVFNHSPYCLPSSISASAYQNFKEGEYYKAVTSTINEVYERLPLPTVLDAVKAVTGDKFAFEKMVGNEILVPSFSKNIAEQMDKDEEGNVRPVKIYTGDVLQTVMNIAKSKIPGLRSTLETKPELYTDKQAENYPNIVKLQAAGIILPDIGAMKFEVEKDDKHPDGKLSESEMKTFLSKLRDNYNQQVGATLNSNWKLTNQKTGEIVYSLGEGLSKFKGDKERATSELQEMSLQDFNKAKDKTYKDLGYKKAPTTEWKVEKAGSELYSKEEISSDSDLSDLVKSGFKLPSIPSIDEINSDQNVSNKISKEEYEDFKDEMKSKIEKELRKMYISVYRKEEFNPEIQRNMYMEVLRGAQMLDVETTKENGTKSNLFQDKFDESISGFKNEILKKMGKLKTKVEWKKIN